MSDDDLIRRGDALYAIAGWEIPSTAIAALPAVTVGVKPLVWEVCALPRHDKNKWIAGPYVIHYVEGFFLVYGWNDKFKHTSLHLDDAKAAAQADYTARILAALTPTAVDASQPADPVVNAPAYSLAPHLQRIVEGAKTAPQWDTVSDRMAAPDPDENDWRFIAAARELVPALRAALDEAEATLKTVLDRESAAYARHDAALAKAEAERDAANALLLDGLLTVQTGRNEPLVIWSETVAAYLGAKP